MSNPQALLAFLQAQRARHTRHFAATPGRLLAFVGTTSEPGTHADMLARPIMGVESDGADGVEVVLRGQLPRALRSQERLTVSIPNLRTFAGFQLKTGELTASRERDLCRSDGGRTTIRARFIYTVHESPNVKHPFGRAPIEHIAREAKAARYALVGIGCNVNISPRFVWQIAPQDDGVRLYWGDGHLNKTAVNFEQNRSISVLVVDLKSFDGMLLRGEGVPLSAEGGGAAYEAVVRGFRSGGWGEPSLVVEARLGQWGKA